MDNLFAGGLTPQCVLDICHAGNLTQDLIYLHGETCRERVGLTMTLAHELQHYVQHGTGLDAWAAGTLTLLLSGDILVGRLGLTWCDIPHEREARLVSKRVAEELFGVGEVKNYINQMASESVTPGDAADWVSVGELDTGSSYNLADETRIFYRRLRDYRPELERALKHFANDPDFRGVDLDALLDPPLVA